MSFMEPSDRDALAQRFKAVTEQDLPVRSRDQHWPLRQDHCFKRVCLDWACQDCWYGHIARPAERHIDAAQLERALRCAEELLDGDEVLLCQRNAASLRWRGKQRYVRETERDQSP